MPYDHFPFSKGLDHWMARHNRYATMEARVALQGAGGARPSLARALWAKDFNERRFHQKGLFLKMPFRPFIKLFYLMAVRRAFLDGRPGVTYAVLQSIYEYLIILKMRELRTAPAAVSTSGPPPPPGGTVATDHRTILGINFFVGSAGEAVRLGLKGGLVVAPAAPALVKLSEDEHYRTAVTEANLAITDSAFMVMLWNLTQRDRIRRISGLEYLVLLLAELKRQPDESMFLVMPGSASAELTVAWLTAQGFAAGRVDTYVAPRYSGKEIADAELLQMLEQKRPAQIIIGLGGGTQEKLGLFLRRGLNYAPGIHCIGAAIGFLTGDQVRIPLWADHLYLGWLFRCVDQPRNYIPRYWTARKLARLMVKNGARIPE
jgi:UDP-N-acetyl-D-mannosaminuronic acid transferase (WecB/TagA/CpsF family)